MGNATLKTISLQEPKGPGTYLSADIYEPPKSEARLATFLLLPFWGGSANTYSKVQHSLVTRCPQHASIAISYKGTGKSSAGDASDDDPARHSIRALTDDLLRFLQAPDIKQLVDVRSLIICAHSMSAKVALRLASTLPPDANIRMRSLLLLAPAPPGPLVLPPEVRKGQLTAYDSLESANWTIDNVLTHGKLDDEARSRLADSCVSMSPGARKGWIEIGMAESIVDLIETADTQLRNFPIRVLAGVCDKVETLERVEGVTIALLRELGFEVDITKLENCGHLIPLERPDAVVEQLSILAQAK